MNDEYEQSNIFEESIPLFKINKHISLIELFGGIGSQAKALEKLQEKRFLPHGFSHYKLVEYDKYPVASYNAIHNTTFSPLDITKIHADDLGIRERERECYLMTYSFPCQDISANGKQKGLHYEGSRSGLLFEVERLLNELGDNLPQVLLMENNPPLLGIKFIDDFRKWERFLESKGYSNYVKIVDATEVGYPTPIPQSRSRVIMVSILGDYYYKFPRKQELKTTLQDFLEQGEVDERYYLSENMIRYIVASNDKWTGNNSTSLINKKIASCINTGEGHRRCDASNYVSDKLPLEFNAKKLFVKTNNAKGFEEANVGDTINFERLKSTTRRGRVGKQVAQTIETTCWQGVVLNDLRIRKLTSKECWRLMGFDDSDWEKASKVNSDTQLYKQAGNAIVVNVLEAIFKQML